MSIFTGAGVALVTPFKEDLSVDYDQLEKFIDFQIDNGTGQYRYLWNFRRGFYNVS